MITRRRFVESGVATLAALAGLAPFIDRLSAAEAFEVVHTDAEWRKLLTPDQYSGPSTGSHGASVQQPVES